MEERIQKLLAQAGFGSRRACEALITAGRVRVNGRIPVLGDKADPSSDRIEVDGQVIPNREVLVYIALHKPRGVISAANDPIGRTTVRDLVELPGQLYPVGRLDFDSEGLILLTNDGELANRLTHPRYEHEKEYRVLVARRPDAEQLDAWRRGVVLEDGYRSLPADVSLLDTAGKGQWLRVVLKEGRKRQIRETGFQLGLPVVRILRVRIGSLELGTLKVRQWRHLSAAEVASLRAGPPAVKKTGRARSQTAQGRPSSARTSSSPSIPQERRQGSGRPAPGRPHTAGSDRGQARPPRRSGQGGKPRLDPPRPVSSSGSPRKPKRPKSSGG